MALSTLKSLNAEIKHLEAQKKLVEKRDSEVPSALAILEKYASVLSSAQRRQVAKLIGEALDVQSTNASRHAKGAQKGRKLGKVAPKYRLPSGETWTGRGLAPIAFAAWSKSTEGRAWAKENPGARFPLIGAEVKKVPAKAVRKGVKTTKKISSPTVKRAAKRVVQKAARKA